MRLTQVALVTLGLMLASAILGAACGVLAFVPVLILALLRGSASSHWWDAGWLIFVAAAIGAAIGVVSGPLLAWSLLRHVSLGRVFRYAVIGTTIGSFVGFGLATIPWMPDQSVIAGGIGGLILSCVILRLRVSRDRRSNVLER